MSIHQSAYDDHKVHIMVFFNDFTCTFCLTKFCAPFLQALLDVYTIQRELGRLDDFKIGMIGDLANGRTVRSLAFVLSMYRNVKMYFVSPNIVKMKDDIKSYLSAEGVAWEEVDDLREVAHEVDVLYQTRIQKERFQDRPDDFELAKGKYVIDKGVMAELQPHAVVMHPLPRVDEVRRFCQVFAQVSLFLTKLSDISIFEAW